MCKKLIIIGASGHGKVIANIAELNGYTEIYFLDDDKSKTMNGKYNIIATTHDIDKYISQGDYEFFIGIGNNEIRKKIYEMLKSSSAIIPSFIHPQSVIDSSVIIDEGTVIMANAVINSSTKIGKCCIINTASTVDHDCIIGDFTHISPGVHIAGTVNIGKNCWIGVGCSVINNLKIYDDVTVGAGTTIIGDIKESGKYVGLPLRRLD